MDGVIEGRIVHYVLPRGAHKGEHRPAIIVKTWPQLTNGTVNMLVFTDCTNDVDPNDAQSASYGSGMTWAPSTQYSEEKLPHTWHWIEGE